MKTIKLWATAAVCLLVAATHGHATPGGAATPPGELVQNGDFEAAPAGGTQAQSTTGLPGWSFVREGDAQGDIARDDAAPPAPAGPHALRLTTARLGRRCGAANDGGPGGMAVRPGAWYDVSFFCRTADGKHTGLVFSLESPDGRTVCARVTLPEVGGDWQPYTLSLHADAADRHARLVISPIDPGTLWLDGVSVVPRVSKEAPLAPQ